MRLHLNDIFLGFPSVPNESLEKLLSYESHNFFLFQQIFNGLNKTQFGQGLGLQTLIQSFKTLVIPNSQIGFN